jgi:2-iminobutanoate/2-iminopropanoate deaminase
VLAELGCSLAEVVKVTCYITGLEHAEGFTRAHAQYFADTLPTATCVGVTALFGEGSVAEIELIAVTADAG